MAEIMEYWGWEWKKKSYKKRKDKDSVRQRGGMIEGKGKRGNKKVKWETKFSFTFLLFYGTGMFLMSLDRWQMLRLPSYTVQWFRIVILEMKLIYPREKYQLTSQSQTIFLGFLDMLATGEVRVIFRSAFPVNILIACVACNHGPTYLIQLDRFTVVEQEKKVTWKAFSEAWILHPQLSVKIKSLFFPLQKIHSNESTCVFSSKKESIKIVRFSYLDKNCWIAFLQCLH